MDKEVDWKEERKVGISTNHSVPFVFRVFLSKS